MSRPDGSAHRYHPEAEPQERELAPFLGPQGCVWKPSHVAVHRWDRNPTPRTRPMFPEDRVRLTAADHHPRASDERIRNTAKHTFVYYPRG